MLLVIFSGLIAAIFWNLFTWWFGIPSSSSHTLIGGFAGAAIAYGGFATVNPDPVIKTIVVYFSCARNWDDHCIYYFHYGLLIHSRKGSCPN